MLKAKYSVVILKMFGKEIRMKLPPFFYLTHNLICDVRIEKIVETGYNLNNGRSCTYNISRAEFLCG